jgi:hypothetical protein
MAVTHGHGNPDWTRDETNRCKSTVGNRAIRSYIERKHRRLAKILVGVAPGDTLGYRSALKDYDLRDPQIAFCRKPINLQKVWEAGKPNWTALGFPTRDVMEGLA